MENRHETEFGDAAAAPGSDAHPVRANTSTAAKLPLDSPRILAPGRNIWRIEQATRAAVLVDADRYYRRLEQSLLTARRSIWILGWDFNGRISLRPDGSNPQTLGSLLRSLVEKHEHLEIRLLIWSLGAIYSQKRLNLSLDEDWADHPRLHLRFDSKHPLRACHHQKLVCIDDTIAFAGGIDLTVKRWDTSEHLAGDPARNEPDGTPYPPVHDVQMVVEGNAALSLGDLARERWRIATGEEHGSARPVAECWPHGLQPDLVGAHVAIARTWPALSGRTAKREVALLNHDAMTGARRSVYIETQYFASTGIARILADRLRDKDGPEIVILVTESARGLFERFVMGGNRDRLIRRLKRSDRFKRLRVMYAVVPGKHKECEVLIHSKVVIVDDRFLRIGSSNLNNRSEGLDTECDLAVEARNQDERRSIAKLRDRLLAEHLESTPEAVRAAVEEEGSIVRAIDRLNTRPRGLRAFQVGPGRTGQLLGTGLLDPQRPYWPLQWLLRQLRHWAHRISGGAS